MTQAQEVRTAHTLNLHGAMRRYTTLSALLWIVWCPVAYASTFTLGRDISATAIGIALAVGNILAVVIQPFISSAADGKGKLDLRTMSVFASAITTVCFGICSVVYNHFIILALIAVIYMFAQNLPALSNSISVYYINRGAKINYGLARGVGSATWSITSLVLGKLISMVGADVIVWIACAFGILMTISFAVMPTPKDVPPLVAQEDESAAEENSGGESYFAFLGAHPNFMRLVIGFSLCFVMGNLIMTYAILIFEKLGAGSSEMGLALAISAMSELVFMFSMSTLDKRGLTTKLMSMAAIGYILKHLVITAAACALGSVPLLYVGYGLQMVSYAIYTPASVYYCNEHFGEGDKNKALGLTIMVNPISAALGSAVGGVLVDSFGVEVMLVFGLVLTIAGALIALSGIRQANR